VENEHQLELGRKTNSQDQTFGFSRGTRAEVQMAVCKIWIPKVG